MRFAPWLFAVLLALDATAAEPPALKKELEAGFSYENLTNDRPPWRSVYVHGVWELAPRKVVYGNLQGTDRFGEKDAELMLGGYYPFDANWTGQLEASMSPTNEVLAKYSVFGMVGRRLPQGFGAAAGLRHSEYRDGAADVLTAIVERYFGAWRASYTLSVGRPEGAPSASSHRFQIQYYYGDQNVVGLSYTGGREVENVGPPTGIITSDVRNVTLSGRHWIAQNWALTWDVLTHEQGTLYRRTGGRVGLRYRF